jgi:hypothetical protein
LTLNNLGSLKPPLIIPIKIVEGVWKLFSV